MPSVYEHDAWAENRPPPAARLLAQPHATTAVLNWHILPPPASRSCRN